MFDFAWSEIALIGIVALVLIGPKDLPVAVRVVTDAIKKMRRMASELQGHVDEMVRDADLGEARDTFRDLRSMNLRGQIMRAVDSDGSVRRTLSDKPLAGQNLMAARTSPPPTITLPPADNTLPPATLPASRQVPTTAPPAFVPPTTARPAHGPEPAAEPASPPPAFVPPAATRAEEPAP